MAGYRSFAKNVGILTLANFSSKILGFLLVPLYTSILTTAEYGTYDLILSTINVLIPILTQNIIDAVLRFAMESGTSKDGVFSVGLKHFLISLLPVCVFLIVNMSFGVFPQLADFASLVFLLFVSQTLSSILLYYARGLNRFTDIAISSVMCSALTIGCNVLFLIVLGWGLSGYFLANIVGPFIQCAYLLFRLGIKGVNPFRVDKTLEHDMLVYSRPMIANTIAWWVNNVSDRYVVTLFCGIGINGIYSVASKIPSILSVVQSVVNQAWTVSAIEEFDPEDSNGFFSNMYAGYNCIMVMACSFLIVCNLLLSKLLYANEFFSAWQYVPFLTISIVFGALTGYLGGILSAVKDSKEFARSSLVGAGFNLALNFILVPLIGALGAAVATMVSYWIVWMLRLRSIKKYMKIRVKLARDYASYVLLVVQGIVFFLPLDLVGVHVCELSIFIFVLALYRRELFGALRRGRLLLKREK